MGAPVRDVEEGVEVAVHQGGGVALEVAPVVRVGEAHRRDLGPRGQGPQLVHLLLDEGAVDRAELVVLVFAHGGTSCGALTRMLPGSWDSCFAETHRRTPPKRMPTIRRATPVAMPAYEASRGPIEGRPSRGPNRTTT